MRHLTAIIFDKRVSEAWSTDYLPLVQRIMNAKVHDTIGVSPAESLFGVSSRPSYMPVAHLDP
jgi:hypothetical protein